MRVKFSRVNNFLPVALCLLATQYAPAQSPVAPTQSAQQIVAKAEEYMNAAVRFNRFSGSILIARDGQPIISKGYGMANYELDVPNTPQTVFRLGSVTKSFTAIAVMMLQERGKLSVNDPVCKHLGECPAAWQPVTIRHLLLHTSGIPSYTALPDYRKTETLPVTHASMIARFRDKPLEWAPGERAAYNNSGYYLLGVIIERAAGKSYEDFLRENIFEPLGMAGTGYDSSRRVIKNRADGYEVRDGSLVNAAYLDMSIPYAGGALYSTAEDLLRWEQSLYSERLLSRKSLDEMFTPVADERGYGWTVREQLGQRVIEKDGGINGFSAIVYRFPADRTTIIVLCNVLGVNFGATARVVANDLAAIAFGAPYKMPQAPRERKAVALDAKTLDKYVGRYQVAPSPLFPPDAVISITSENGGLMRQVNDGPKAELFAESETEFFLKTADVQVTFVVDAQGRVTGLVWHRLGRDIPATKIK
jgi:CubicO group peptidase (beta-lactamase class C family)